MNLQTIFAAAVILAVFFMIRSKQRRGNDPEDTEAAFFDSARLQSEVNALHRCMQELEQLDAMLIDLRLCKPDELHRAFRVEWQGTTGQRHALDFMSNGTNANTAHMIELAESQREELNAEIQSRIIDLYARAQSMDFYTRYDAERTERSYTNGETNDAAGEVLP